MSNFRQFDRATGFLLPPSLDEWLPERHLARFVVEVIDGLDLSAMVFMAREIADLLAQADQERLALVTTEKDLARLAGDPHASELVARTAALPVTLKVRDPAGFERMVLGAVGPRQAAEGFSARR